MQKAHKSTTGQTRVGRDLPPPVLVLPPPRISTIHSPLTPANLLHRITFTYPNDYILANIR